jgi:hypothetical protein
LLITTVVVTILFSSLLLGYSGLRNNETIAKRWIKLLSTLITRRAAFLKDVEKNQKWLNYTASSSETVIAAQVYRRFKHNSNNNSNNINKDSLLAQLSDISYWKRHDWNTNNLLGLIWVQHAMRANTYSYATNRVLLQSNNNNNNNNDDDNNNSSITNVSHPSGQLTLQAISLLLDLTRHNYDAIRPQARKTFEKLAPYLGYKLMEFIQQLLNLLRIPQATYYQTASTLVTLKQSVVMRKIVQVRNNSSNFL